MIHMKRPTRRFWTSSWAFLNSPKIDTIYTHILENISDYNYINPHTEQ